MTPFAQRTSRFATSFLAALAAVIVAACGGGGGGGDGSAGNGTLRLALTDAPACYDAVFVTINKIRFHQSSTAGEGDAGWAEIAVSPTKRIDLLTLTNGLLQELGQTALPAGKYTQMRVVLAPNDNTSPRANAVTPAGGTETPMDTPSGTQSGLKFNINIDVASGQVADFVLDFDACKSVVRRGQSGRYNLKPVITVIPRLANAAIIGYLPAELGTGATSVSAQRAGDPIRATRPDSNGRFVIAPIPAGTFDVVIVSPGRATATVTGVPVSDTAGTTISTATDRIDPPASTMRTISGAVTITPLPALVEAIVVARKAYTGGPTVEVAGIPANGSDGTFSLSVPAAAPWKAPYVSGAASPSFTADSATPTGKYSVVATVGATSKSADVDVTLADATGVSLSFP